MSELSEAEINLLGQISENLGLLRESLGQFNKRMEVQEEISRQMLVGLAILNQRMDTTEKMEGRMDKLDERLRDAEMTVKGAGMAATWVSKIWPFVAGVVGGLAGMFAGQFGFNQP